MATWTDPTDVTGAWIGEGAPTDTIEQSSVARAGITGVSCSCVVERPLSNGQWQYRDPPHYSVICRPRRSVTDTQEWFTKNAARPWWQRKVP